MDIKVVLFLSFFALLFVPLALAGYDDNQTLTNVTDALTNDSNITTHPADINDGVYYWYYSNSSNIYEDNVAIHVYYSNDAQITKVQLYNSTNSSWDTIFQNGLEHPGSQNEGWYNSSRIGSDYFPLKIRVNQYRISQGIATKLRVHEIQVWQWNYTPMSPTNASTIYTTYPPLTNTVYFSWENYSSSQYRLMVAEDVNFNVIAIDEYMSTNTSSQTLLVNKQYWWKVYNYDGTTHDTQSDVYNFNLTGNSTLTGSAIEGVVYADVGGTNTALSSAEVTIWNTTWTDTSITGSNGYYLFTDVVAGQVYNVQAKKDLYLDSSVALVNATADPTTQDFFLLPDRTSEEWRHYVKFIVWGVSGYYEDITVTVYENDDVTATYIATTGTDGAVTFIMDRQQEYRVTFINATQGINREMTLYPKAEEYLIFVSSSGSWTTYDEPIDDVISIGISTSIINSTHAYVNVTYNDTLTQTTDATVYLNQSNRSDPYNQTVIDSQGGLTNNWTHSFIVANYTGESYYIHVVATHTTYGTIDQTYSVQFEDEVAIEGISENAWLYIALLVLVFTGGMFGQTSVHMGAGIVSVEAWVFYFFGWFNSIDSGGIMVAGLAFATVVAIIANINHYNKAEGHE